MPQRTCSCTASCSRWELSSEASWPSPCSRRVCNPPIALGQAIGRIGCYLAGCCYGAPTSSACGVIFPANVGSSAPA
ncbi:MAG: prolipoprotein diacylglyceryl transferase, partial [Prevotella sp.]|nr:prolipoprotein diacylglyceryl transferase [Prevotella sp.]